MIKVTDKGYYMEQALVEILNSIIYNVPNDWDSIILITGSGMVRVGKSVLAQQVAYYCAYNLKTKFDINNVVFTGEELINKAKNYPKNSVFIYDEARNELDTKKVLEQVTKTLMDFFAECGMYNHVIVLVLPDFFDLPKGLAMQRSELLLNVYRKGEVRELASGIKVEAFTRGYFTIYNRGKKKQLYEMGKKKFHDYDSVKGSYPGEFSNTFLVDKEAYEAKKLDFLQRSRGRSKQEIERLYLWKLLGSLFSFRDLENKLKEVGFMIDKDTIHNRIKFVEGEIGTRLASTMENDIFNPLPKGIAEEKK